MCISVVIYDNVCNPIGPNKEVICDCPTGVVSGEYELASRRVEMIPKPV